MKRIACSACAYGNLEPFLDLGNSPIADAYPSDGNIESPAYPLELAVCPNCWLVQLLEVLTGELLFETGYSFYSSSSAPLSAYHSSYAADIVNVYGEKLEDGVLEIGCNDGDFLRHFKAFGYGVIGVDPASGPVSVAQERGLTVIQQAFDAKLAEDIVDDFGRFGVVVANHVLAHVESVSEVLEGISRVLLPDGVAFIEVQYVGDLLLNNAFDLVYHEHRNFFSLGALREAAALYGLKIRDVEQTDRQGGSIRVELALGDVKPSYNVKELIAQEALWLKSASTYSGFQGRVERIRMRLADLVLDAGAPVYGYGAPAKATTLLNFCHFDVKDIHGVYDTTAAKQGKFIPNTGIPILEPQVLRTEYTYLVLAWNYAPYIMRKHRRFNGDWIVPFPAPVVF